VSHVNDESWVRVARFQVINQFSFLNKQLKIMFYFFVHKLFSKKELEK